ncbi:MAG: leucine-rich repeat domain-containing protein [Oscillospiraceae bacterium]|nr:leucine-rich repeat domain-containing protein [Oscillospiraceae bacterium]
MNDKKDFVISKKCLQEYIGTDRDVVVPEGVEKIGGSAFSYDARLNSVSVPGSVTKLDEWTFNGCDALKSVVLHDGTLSIGDYAFKECISLEEIIIPESVKSIGVGAFMDSLSLIIHAPSGSYAERFAKENGIPCEAI